MFCFLGHICNCFLGKIINISLEHVTMESLVFEPRSHQKVLLLYMEKSLLKFSNQILDISATQQTQNTCVLLQTR